MKTNMTHNQKYYYSHQESARNEAIEYQNNFENIMKESNISIFEWAEHFRKSGKRFGLMREFIENGII